MITQLRSFVLLNDTFTDMSQYSFTFSISRHQTDQKMKVCYIKLKQICPNAIGK